MTGLSDLHLDYQACKVLLTVTEESGHIKTLGKGIAEDQKGNTSKSRDMCSR